MGFGTIRGEKATESWDGRYIQIRRQTGNSGMNESMGALPTGVDSRSEGAARGGSYNGGEQASYANHPNTAPFATLGLAPSTERSNAYLKSGGKKASSDGGKAAVYRWQRHLSTATKWPLGDPDVGFFGLDRVAHLGTQ